MNLFSNVAINSREIFEFQIYNMSATNLYSLFNPLIQNNIPIGMKTILLCPIKKIITVRIQYFKFTTLTFTISQLNFEIIQHLRIST